MRGEESGHSILIMKLIGGNQEDGGGQTGTPPVNLPMRGEESSGPLGNWHGGAPLMNLTFVERCRRGSRAPSRRTAERCLHGRGRALRRQSQRRAERGAPPAVAAPPRKRRLLTPAARRRLVRRGLAATPDRRQIRMVS
jgi:hypothetical protein